MASYGKIAEFNADQESWVAYSERLTAYFDANEITTREQKRAILISVIGARTYSLLRSLVSPSKPSDKSYVELIALLENHFDPKPSPIIQRFKFNTCSRKAGQSISTFVAELRSIAEHCDYGQEIENMLRDRLVCGVSDDRIQRRLLSEPTLNYKKALEIAQGIESANRNISDIQQAVSKKEEGVHQISSYNKHGKRNKPVQQNFKYKGNKNNDKSSHGNHGNSGKHCYRCGADNHTPEKCYYKDEVCKYCHIKGHILRACRRRKSSSRPSTNIVDEVEVDSEHHEEYGLYHVGDSETSVPPYYLSLTMNNKPVKLQIDTGATFSILTKAHYNSIWSRDEAPQIQKTTRVLRSYTGEKLAMLGIIDVVVNYKNMNVSSHILVVDEDRPSLLGRDWINLLGLNFVEHVPVDSICEVSKPTSTQDIIDSHPEIFEDGIGEIKGAHAKIHVDPDAKPRFFKPRSVPYAMRQKVEDELEKLVREGIVEPVQFSDWATPIVPVLKSDGSVRVCGDYKVTVNQVSTLDTYPIPKIDDLYAQLSGGQTFTKIDLASAYLQLPLDESSKIYTTINTHRGLFRYNRLPFGISSSPGIFQRYIDNLLQGLPMTCGYQDDIIISGKDDADHVKNVDSVLTRLSSAGVRVKKEKCVFQAKEVTYLGHRIDADGLHPVMDKVEAITKAPTPTNVSELKSYLGLLNYYGKFLPNLSTVLSPLHQLLKKDVKWKWTPAQQNSFDKSKSLLNSSQVLVHYDSGKDLILATDTSQYGLGAVLSHIYDDGTERPIAFSSRTLNSAERNYSQIEKEGLSVIFGIKKFHSYLYGRRFFINNDHKPLETLFGEKKAIPVTASGRIQRWALTLSAYDYTFKYKPGKKLCHADAMSRLPLNTVLKSVPTPQEVVDVVQFLDSTPITSADIERSTQKNPVLSRVRRFITNGWTDTPDPETQPFKSRQSELSVHGGIILWGARVVVPPQCQVRVLQMLHQGHPGIVRMKMLARSYVWWPNIDSDIEATVHECSQCQTNAKATPSVQMHPWEYPQNPWTRVHIDYAGPFENKMFLIVVDAHSKWIDVHITNSTSSQVTIEKLERTFATCGLPVTIVSDNGTSFTSSEFREFLSNNGIEQMFSPPYHPSSNGLAERSVQTFKDYMKKTAGQPIQPRVSRFLFHYRSTPNTTTGKSPAELMFKRKMRTHLDLCHPDEIAQVRRKQAKQQASDAKTHRKSVAEGDAVYITNMGKGPSWIPGLLVSRKQSVCIVRLLDGRTVRRHLDHIKSRQAEELQPPVHFDVIPRDLVNLKADNTPATDCSSSVIPITPTSLTGVDETSTTVTKPNVTVTQQLRRSSRSSRPPQRLDL